MNTTTKATGEKVKDLILLNNDRDTGYEKALSQTEDADLKQLFSKLASESRKFSEELKGILPAGMEIPAQDETTNSGKLYRVWMDIKNAMSTNDRKSVLASCEYGEDVIKKAYEDALRERDELDANAVSIMQRQYDVILESHDKVKALRDAAKK